MKQYPQILGAPSEVRRFKAYVFDKLDGSNIRFEWSKKQGFYKFGTRRRLLDPFDPIYGPAIDIFFAKYAEKLSKIFRELKWERCMSYAEYFGPESFAGIHSEDDIKDNDMDIVLFDVSVHRKGLLGPREFLDTFKNHVELPRFLGIQNWGPELVRKVRAGELGGVTFEGIVGKAGSGHKLVMRKAKSQIWIDMVKARYNREEAAKIINS